MSRILAGIVAWNEADSIGKAIRSVAAYVDGIVVVDAVFHGNVVGMGTCSDDEQEDVVRAVYAGPTTYLRPYRRLWEDEARNLYLDCADPGDWILVIDGDEILVGDHRPLMARVETIRATADQGTLPPAYAVAVYSTAVLFPGHAPDVTPVQYQAVPVIAHRGWQPRLFRVRRGLRYRKNDQGKRHTAYMGETPFGVGAERIDDFLILNDHVAQTWARYQADYAWETHEARVGA